MDSLRYLSILSTIFSAVFAYSVLQRYARGRRAHSLLWGIGLIFYGLGTFSEAVLAFAYHPLVLKIWYLSGAMLTAAWLGQGTIHLLVRRGNIARNLSWTLAAISLVAFVLVFAAPAMGTAYDVTLPASGQYKEILTRSGLTILLTVVLNIYGSVGLIGGAIVSAWLFWQKRVLPNRVMGNVLIAAGALMPATAGSFIKAGMGDWLYISELVGVILMFAGYVLATQPQMEESAPTSEPAPAAR